MIISVRCPQCGWRGHAVVGEDFSKRDYKCPGCGYGSLQRPRRGTPAGNIARLKVKKLERKKRGSEEDEKINLDHHRLPAWSLEGLARRYKLKATGKIQGNSVPVSG